MSLSENITERYLGIEQLTPGKYQPRKNFDRAYLETLADSIKQDGVLEPLIVRSIDNKNKYEIVAGECRWRAAQIAGLFTVPCRVGVYTNEQACRIALVENTIRSNLNPIEEAEGIARLIEEFSYTHEKVSQTLSIPRTEVTNYLRFLKLVTPVKQMLREGLLNVAQAKILAGIKNILNQNYFALECIKKQWSSRDLDKAIKLSQKQKVPINNQLNNTLEKDVNTVQLEKNLSDYFGYSTKINLDKDNSGYLNIRFYNLDGLQSILEKAGFSEANQEEFIAEY